MRTLLPILAAALAATGCSPAMYAMHRGTFAPPPGYALRPNVQQMPTGRWDNVMRLPHGSTIDVLTTDGVANVGKILGADIDTVRLAIEGSEVRLARADVVRVDLVDIAGSETMAVARKTARGALLGAGFVALVSGVMGREAWPPSGPALRTGAAIGGVSAGQAEVANRAGGLIYLAPEPLRLPPGARPR